MKFVLFQNSNTQRITVNIQEDNTVLFSKEFRKSTLEEWKIGKGITVPINHIVFLGKLLSCNDKEELKTMIKTYEIIEGE